MIIGDPLLLAIESHITAAYECVSLRAIGCFMIHVGGRCYGVRAPDSTMLANSFDEVERRIAHRGKYTAPFATEADAGQIADAFRNACFADEGYVYDSHFGMSFREFTATFSSEGNDCMWAPDGDEAFDDGSYILQFDVGERVRLIAFKSVKGSWRHDPTTLSDVWLPADEFYHVLQQWHEAFHVEWIATSKAPEEYYPGPF